MVFFLLVCEKIPVHDGFFYSHPFFFCLYFIPNTTAICKNKIRPSSEPKIISKKLENSHLSSFSVNLTDIFKIIAKYRRNVISKYRQKLLFIGQWKLTIMFILLMPDQIFLFFKFSYVVRYFT